MNEQSFSAMLRNLAWEYYNRRLEFQDYRAQRKHILDEIDLEYNGAGQSANGDVVDPGDPSSMGTIIFSIQDNEATDT